MFEPLTKKAFSRKLIIVFRKKMEINFNLKAFSCKFIILFLKKKGNKLKCMGTRLFTKGSNIFLREFPGHFAAQQFNWDILNSVKPNLWSRRTVVASNAFIPTSFHRKTPTDGIPPIVSGPTSGQLELKTYNQPISFHFSEVFQTSKSAFLHNPFYFIFISYTKVTSFRPLLKRLLWKHFHQNILLKFYLHLL